MMPEPVYMKIPMRLIGGALAMIELPTQMTELQWEHLLAILAAHKPGFVDGEEVS